MDDFQISASLYAIFGMAVVTLLTRVVGYWAIGKFSVSGRLKIALEVMPGAVLLSIVVPTAFATGWPEAVAAILTALLALRVPLLAAISGGVLMVVALRYTMIL